MRPSLPAPQGPRPVCLPSRFPQISGSTFFPNWWILDWPSVNIGWYSTNEPNGTMGLSNGSPKRLSYGVFPLGNLSWIDSSNIRLNPPANFRPIPIATISQMFLFSFCVRLSQQSHLFLNGEGLMCNHSTIGLRRLYQFSRTVSVNDVASWKAPRTFASSF